MVCECEKLGYWEDSNSAVRDYKWIKTVALDNVIDYVLEKLIDYPLTINFLKNLYQ